MKKIKILCAMICLCLIGSFAFAATIYLKSGKKVEGDILQRTDDMITVSLHDIGVTATYYLDEIRRIEAEGDSLPGQIQIENAKVLSISDVALDKKDSSMQGLVVVAADSYRQGDDSPFKKTITTAYFQDGKARTKMEGSDIIIFRDEKRVYWTLDKTNQTYQEVPFPGINTMQENWTQAMEESKRQYDAQMEDESIPEDNKELLQQFWNELSNSSEIFQIKKTASGVKLNDWLCDQYEIYVKGDKDMEIWIADLTNYGFSTDEIASLEKLQGVLPSSLFAMYENCKGLAGASANYPKGAIIKIVQFGYKGNIEAEVQIVDIKRQDLNQSLFEVPAGYKKIDLPEEMKAELEKAARK